MMLRATRPGTLPGLSDVSFGTVKLPPGRLVTPQPAFEAGRFSASERTPALWVTEERVADMRPLWGEVASSFAQHGLWPLVLESLDDEHDDRPWLAGELRPSRSSSPDDHDAGRVLEEQWLRVVPSAKETPAAFERLKPFGRTFPGLSPATVGAGGLAVLAAIAGPRKGRLGLVPVLRPADVPSALGWYGPVNHYEDMGKLSAVLRSWEERFGAYVIGMGFDTLTLAVQRPVKTLDHAVKIAAEHLAMCPDNVYQGAGSIIAYAKTLVDKYTWNFWWD
jgi:hypothetical protein